MHADDRGQWYFKVSLGKDALTVNELLDLHLDGLDADQRLSPKTRHDYRVYAQACVRKPLDNRKVLMSPRS